MSDPAFPRKGYVYAVCGPEKYYREAVESARTLKTVDAKAHTTLITGGGHQDMREEVFDVVREVEQGGGESTDWLDGLTFKASTVYEHSPYDRSFFVDSDTYFVDNCRGLFRLLNHFDLSMSQAPVATKPFYSGDEKITGYRSYNSGVILFKKNERVKALFARWKEALRDVGGELDQRILTDVLLQSAVDVHSLPKNWNARIQFFDGYTDRVHLIHGRHPNLDRIARLMNVTKDNRAWLPFLEACVYRSMSISDVFRLIPKFFHGIGRRYFGLSR